MMAKAYVKNVLNKSGIFLVLAGFWLGASPGVYAELPDTSLVTQMNRIHQVLTADLEVALRARSEGESVPAETVPLQSVESSLLTLRTQLEIALQNSPNSGPEVSIDE